uniref:PH domain-containing protein n=1 Tax=Aureoumbra lagunensis TaxID=44058 RepID=A0A7S3K4V0_9STRA
MDEAKGALLLTLDCVIREVSEPRHAYCFEVASGFETLRVAATSREEADAWKNAISDAVAALESTMQRGFLDLQTIRRASVVGGSKVNWVRKFFVLHSNTLTYHQDHYNTYKNLGEFKLTAETTIFVPSLQQQQSAGEHILELVSGIHETPETQVCIKVRARDANELETWRTAIDRAVQALKNRDDLASKRGATNDETVVKDGYLATQAACGGTEKWPQQYYALTASALYQAQDTNSAEALAVYLIEPACSAYTTTLRPHAFELVTSQGVLHLAAESAEATDLWLNALRKVIANSTSLKADPLLTAARKLPIERYEVRFITKQKLNIVLERANQWAIVKQIPKGGRADLVSEGSALAAVNGTCTTLLPYDDTVRLLAGWQPPLILSFIRSPNKEGWLSKQARGRNKNALVSSKNWKKRYFKIQGGRLSYYTDPNETQPKDCIQLTGCAVSLVAKQDADGQSFCFKLNFGLGLLIMQATTLDEMIDWTATLYQAVAIANGGGYILDIERSSSNQKALQNTPISPPQLEENQKYASPPPPPASKPSPGPGSNERKTPKSFKPPPPPGRPSTSINASTKPSSPAAIHPRDTRTQELAEAERFWAEAARQEREAVHRDQLNIVPAGTSPKSQAWLANTPSAQFASPPTSDDDIGSPRAKQFVIGIRTHHDKGTIEF